MRLNIIKIAILAFAIVSFAPFAAYTGEEPILVDGIYYCGKGIIFYGTRIC